MPRKKADISNQLTENMLNAVGVIRAGQKNTFIYVNPTFNKFTGYTEKELLNMSPFDLVHPDMFEVIVKRFKDRLKGKKVPERYETKILTKKGETLWAEVFAKKINYEGIPAVLIVASEISERKLAEQELHNMRFLLDSAQRLAHLGSIEFEFRTGKTIISEEVYRILGIKPQSLNYSYKQFLRLIHPAERKKFQIHCRKAISDKQFGKLEFRIIKPDESVCHVFSTGEIICDKKDTPQRLIIIIQDITEQKRIQRDLKISEAKLSNAMNIAKLGYWEYDVKQDVFIFNDQFYTIFNTSIEQMGSYAITPEQYAEKFIFPEDRSIVRKEIKKALETADPDYKRRIEHRIIKATGETGYISVQLFIEKDQKGQTVKTYGVNQDITHYKSIEVEARNNEKKLRSVFTTAPVGIGVVVNNIVMECNDKVSEITEYIRDEIVGKPIRKMYRSKKEYDRVNNTIYEQIKINHTGTVETKWKTKTGKILDIVFSSSPIDSKDLSKGVTFSILDITDRKKAEISLEESEQLFRSLYENATIGIYRTTPDGRILMANPAAVRMLGFKSFKELAERNLEKAGYEPSYSREEFKKTLRQQGKVIALENAWIRKDRKTIYIRESAIAVKDNRGKIIYYDGTFEDITASKEAERKLQSSEARMRHLLNSTSTVVYSLMIKRNKHIPVWVGDNITQFGYTSKEAMKPDWWIKNIHPDDYQKISALINDLPQSKHLVAEYRFKNGEGRYIWLRDEMVLSQGNKSNSGEIIGSWIDITKRKKAEEALRESEENYRSLIENLTDAVFSLNTDGVMQYLSPAGVYIFNQNIENIIGTALRDYIHPDDLSDWDKNFSNVIEGKSVLSDYKFRANQNDMRYVRIASRPIAKDDRIISITGILSDVTLQKRSEEEIKKLSLAVEQSPSSVIITDINGTIEYVNQKLTQVVGYSRQELIGQKPRIFKSGETPAKTYEELWNTILAGDTWHGELKNKKKDGSIILEDIIISPIKDDKGLIKHFVGLREDITKQRMLEEQLRQSQKMQAIGHLAGGVAHDFNNLLTVISGYSDLILRDMSKDHKHFEKLFQIKLSGQRAEGLTRQLLAFSRKQIMKPVNLDLNILIGEMEKMLKRIIGEDIDLMTIYAKDLSLVKADPGQIEQVILNMVVNSRDAMPSGGKLIIETRNTELDEEFITYHPEASSGMHVEIAVKDTGYGMSKETLNQIFEPFFSTKEKGKGTGLGLSTVYGIVMQSGGYIDVQSKEDEGTIFHIYLPAVNENAISKRSQSDKKIDQGKNETILLVEDEETVRKFIVAVLKKYNFNVLAAADPETALNMVKSKKMPLDILLTDVIMPGMSGKILSEKISRINPEIKIIFMSGYTNDAILKHGVLEEGINFIQKPFTPQDLVKKIKEVLKKRD